MTRYKLYKGDCIKEMARIKKSSIDLILTDPPYGIMKTKGERKHEWDTVINMEAMYKGCNDALRESGALIPFSQGRFTADLVTNEMPNLKFSYKYTWLKESAGNVRMCKVAPVSVTEDVCCFFKKYNIHQETFGNTLREYFKAIMKYAEITTKKAEVALGSGRAEHVLRVSSSQFSICTESTYIDLTKAFNLDKMPGFRSFDSIKKENEDFKRTIKRTYNLRPGSNLKKNTLEYSKDTPNLHPTQKPVALLVDLIETYTNPGDTVLDFTMGSGSTGVACAKTGRNFIGIELDDNYFKIASDRIKSAYEEHKVA